MTRHALIVCTANVCRSPSAERLLQRRLDGRVDVDGERWVVRSAGTSSVRSPMDPNTVRAASDRGFDLRDHTARTLNAVILRSDGADLVLAMTREHLRAVAALDPTAWPRTFTLKEIARRASALDPSVAESGFEPWRRSLADGRQASELIRPDPNDDVSDPYGGARREHERMLDEVSELVDHLVTMGPWQTVNGG